MGAKQEVTEEKMLKALSELEDDLLKAEAQSEDESESGKDKDDESVSKSYKSVKHTKKSHIREDRAPMRTMPKSTKEATASLDEEAGAGEKADVSAKSFRDGARENGNIRKALDASPFLEGMFDNLSDEVDGMRKAILYVQDVNMEAVATQDAFNQKLSKALIHMGNLIVEQNEMIKSLGGRPTGVRKSVTSRSEVQERFQKSEGAGEEGGDIGGGEYQFDKNTVLKKAIEMVEMGKLPAPVVIGYETTGSMDPQFQRLVERELTKDAH